VTFKASTFLLFWVTFADTHETCSIGVLEGGDSETGSLFARGFREKWIL
jgi:hypothetical protein